MTHERDRLSGRSSEGNIAQHPGSIRTVSEPHALELDRAPHWTMKPGWRRRLAHHDLLIEEREDALGRCHGALQEIELLRQILKRLEETASVLDERRENADRQRTVEYPKPSVPEQECHGHRGQDLDNG